MTKKGTLEKKCRRCGKPFKVNVDRHSDRNICAKCYNIPKWKRSIISLK